MKLLNIYISRIFIALFVMFIHLQAYTQSQNLPTASLHSGGKQANIPVNYNSGSANLSIPIHNIAEFDLNLPLSISYQTGGIQVSEVASNIGLGWNLNTGGAVYREVKGLPDHWSFIPFNGKKHAGYLEAQNANNFDSDCEGDYVIDTEPDIFTFNLNGITGKFFHNFQGNIVQINDSNIKIEKYVHNEYIGQVEPDISIGNTPLIDVYTNIISGWKFTLPDGTIFIFGSDTVNDVTIEDEEYLVERSYNNNWALSPSTIHIPTVTKWFLKEIESVTGHKIDFEYEKESYALANNMSTTIKVDEFCNVDYGESEVKLFQFQKNRVDTYRLKNIESSFSKIEFIATEEREDLADFPVQQFGNLPQQARKIEEIRILKRNQGDFQCFKNFNFNQDYFISSEQGFFYHPDFIFPLWPHNLALSEYPDLKRLKLNGLRESSCDGSLTLDHTFKYHEEYSLPRRLSKSQDIWGFHNGAYQNKTLIPKVNFASNCIENLDCSNSNHIAFADDMEPNIDFAKTGSLNEISYPNGEIIGIEYEAHEAVVYNGFSGDFENRTIGGLRIKKLNTVGLSKSFEYSKEYEAAPPRSSEEVFLNLCEECPNSPLPIQEPDGGGTNSCQNQSEDREFNQFIACDANIRLRFQVTPEWCTTETMFIRLKWFNNDGGWGGSIQRTIPYTGTTWSDEINHNELVNAGLRPGFTYDFIFETFDNDNIYLSATSRLYITYPHAPQINGEYSSGVIVKYPTVLGLNNRVRTNTLTYFNEECVEGQIFELSTNKSSITSSLAGSHVTYGEVRETPESGEFGYSKYEYNVESQYLNQRFLFNDIDPIYPLNPAVPGIDELIVEPLFGTLKKTSLHSASNVEVQSSEYEYSVNSSQHFFHKTGCYERCIEEDDDMELIRETSNYQLKGSRVLLKKKTSQLDGVTTVEEIDYDFEYFHPIRKTVYALNNQVNKRVTEIKYANDVLRFDLVSKNMVDIPLESLVNGGLSGGTKIEYSSASASAKPKVLAKFYALDDGTWEEEFRINSFNSNGQPTNIKYRSKPLTTDITWQNGLLKEIAYDSRISNINYDNLRRTTSQVSNEGFITSFDSYDGLHRLMEKTDLNGKYQTTYDYFTSISDLEKIVSTISFPQDAFGIPDRISESYFDEKGRTTKTVEKNYTYAGSDFVQESFYDALGRSIQQKDQAVPGIAQTVFEENPLSRPLSHIPAGSPKPITYSYGSNSAGQVPGYNSNSLFKSTVLDENQRQTIQFTDIFGRKICVIDALGQKTLYEYNDRDLVTKIIPPGAGSSDLTKIYTYGYDDKGLLMMKTIPGQSNPYTYSYNDQDILSRQTLSNGTAIEYVIDDIHNDFIHQIKVDNVITQEYFPEHSDLHTSWVRQTKTLVPETGEWLTNNMNLDAYGRVQGGDVDYLNGSMSFTNTLDDMSNVRDLSGTHSGVSGDVFGYSSEFEYDKGLRLKKTTSSYPEFPDQKINSFVYDDSDRLQFKYLGDGLQELSFGYNSRSWLKNINTVESTYAVEPPDCNDPDDETPTKCPPTKAERIIALEVLFNCDDLMNSNPTNVLIKKKEYVETLEGNHVYSDESIVIPFNGGTSLLSVNYSDSHTPTFSADQIETAQEWIESSILDCFGTSLNSLSNENQANVETLILAMDGGDGPIGPPTGPSEPIGKLFGLELNYFNGNSELNAASQFNGNVSWMEWRVNGEIEQQYGFQYDALNRLLHAQYKGEDALECKVLPPGAYDVTIGDYDEIGNIGSITRNGLVEMVEDVGQYGLIDNMQLTSVTNKLTNVVESANPTKGYQNGGGYTYDSNGNLTSDAANGITNITYNYLDLPTLIQSSHGTIEILYDGVGNKLKLTQTPNDPNQEVREIIYQGNVQYVNGIRESILFEEGRILYNADLPMAEGEETTDYMEWSISDHLGNTRVRFTDKDGDGKIQVTPDVLGTNEILGSSHYYPFGMQLEGNFSEEQGKQLAYQYNGIEHFDMMGHGISLADLRVHDAALGRWWQVDPYAESFTFMSPYGAMNDNPISFIDPGGGYAFSTIIFGAAAGAVAGATVSAVAGTDFEESVAIGAAIGAGIGLAVNHGLFSGGGNLEAVKTFNHPGISSFSSFSGLQTLSHSTIKIKLLNSALSNQNQSDPPRKLTFDGERMSVIIDGETIASYAAVSGRPLKNGYFDYSANRQKIHDIGPIPEGEYIVNMNKTQRWDDLGFIQKTGAFFDKGRFPGGTIAWGSERVDITPVGLNPFAIRQRSGFTIHGGTYPGSAGCIDLTTNDKAFFEKVRNTGTWNLTVKYK